jgi:hypothetical protein
MPGDRVDRGKLTAHDAFLTGQATNYDYPADLKDDLIERVVISHLGMLLPHRH